MLARLRSTRLSITAAAVSVAVGAALAVGIIGGPVGAATQDLRPICNNLNFNLPTAAGTSVTIPVNQFAADPDVTPVRLVSVFPTSTPLGTVAISGDVLVFTLTSSATGSVDLYWTVSDSAGLTAQCQALASNVPPPDNG